MRAWAAAGLVGVILCAGCLAAPVAPTAPATTAAPAATGGTGSAAPAPSASAVPRPGLRHVPLAPLGDLGSPSSTPTPAAMAAMQQVWLEVPHDRYGGVVLGGGAGIVVSTLPVADARLASLLREARHHGVIVELLPARRSLAELEALSATGVVRRLPAALRDHVLLTAVDVSTNRVVAGFDLPVDDALRAQVARVFGDEVAVTHVDGPSVGLGAVA